MDENKEKNPPQQEQQETALAKVIPSTGMNAFGTTEGFELAQREAKMLANSDVVPVTFKGKPENCVIALEMSHRIGASPLMVMQNLAIVHGNPSFSSKFLIATVNACGKFSPLRYIMYDSNFKVIEKPNPAQKPFACVASAIELETGEQLYGPCVDLKMAEEEKWSTKDGSKWKTMPDLMLRYRAAAFFQRTYAPEISMGMLTTEEYADLGEGAIQMPGTRKGQFAGAGANIAEHLRKVEEASAEVIETKEPEPGNPAPAPQTEQKKPGDSLFPEQ